MNRDEVIAIIEAARAKGETPDLHGTNLWDADLHGTNLRCADLRDADLRDADLRGANLRCADLRGANTDFSAWPLWCGGTCAKVSRRMSLQLIYHAVNQHHEDAEIRAALVSLRELAIKFRKEYRNDAPPLCWEQENQPDSNS